MLFVIEFGFDIYCIRDLINVWFICVEDKLKRKLYLKFIKKFVVLCLGLVWMFDYGFIINNYVFLFFRCVEN